jgi:membrane-associated phospholipid phosphatase
MSTPRPPFWHRPAGGHFLYSLLLAVAVGAWFEAVYAGADYLTSLHRYRVRVHLDAELLIPFVPESVLGYMSIYPLLAAPAFVLRTRRELRALALTLAAVIAVAGACFLLVPAEDAFPPPGEMGAWSAPVRLARRIALRHNYLPSLHVALSLVCVLVYARLAGPVGRALLWLWGGAIGLSTLLLHQHYLLDVAAAWVLALAGVRLVYDRLAGPAGSGPGAANSALR